MKDFLTKSWTIWILLILAISLQNTECKKAKKRVSQVTQSDLYLMTLTEQNYKNLFGCSALPYSCQTDQQWIFIFYSSLDRRQLETMVNIVRGYKKEIAYSFIKQSKENKFNLVVQKIKKGGITIAKDMNEKGQQVKSGKSKQHQKILVNIGFIDCSSEDLCPNTDLNRLPLTIFSDPNSWYKIKYDGYVTFPGLLSFIQSHDPLTSRLAKQFVEDQDLVQQSLIERSYLSQSQKKQLKKVNQKALLKQIQEQIYNYFQNKENQEESIEKKQQKNQNGDQKQINSDEILKHQSNQNPSSVSLQILQSKETLKESQYPNSTLHSNQNINEQDQSTQTKSQQDTFFPIKLTEASIEYLRGLGIPQIVLSLLYYGLFALFFVIWLALLFLAA